jgi:hypothetical protein
MLLVVVGGGDLKRAVLEGISAFCGSFLFFLV